MANVIYPKYKEALLDGSANVDINDGTVKVALIDTALYTYSASHDFLDDVSGVVGTAQTIGNTTVSGGLFDGDGVTFTSVSGDSVEALIIYIDTVSSATSRLVAYIDSNVSGLPATPSGGNITLSWNDQGIFQL